MANVSVVTGGAGLIGSHLVKALVAKRDDVIVVDNFERGNKDNLKDVKCKIVRHSITTPSGAESALRGNEVDDVYHLAAKLGGVEYVKEHPAECFTPNILMNTNLLEAARKFDVKRLLFTSTACVYPVERQLVPDAPTLKESDITPISPESGYGWAKYVGEKLCEAYREEYGMNIAIVRMFNVYGPGEDMGPNSHVIPMLIRKAVRYPKERFVVWGTGKATRAFTFVTDAVDGIILTMEKGINKGAYNIGGHERVTVQKLAELIKSISGKRDMPIEYDTTKPEGVIGRAADWTRARKELGWNPKVSLKEGLTIVYNWASTVL